MHCVSLYTVLLIWATCLVGTALGQSITSCKLFQEQNGLLVMEAESVLPNDSWSLRNDITDALGSGYYEWKHGDNNQGIDPAGSGILTYTFEISQPGSYRFLLRSSSPDNTEHNDVWVRFPDNPATGIRQRAAGSITIEQNTWFKVYQNTSGQEWKWDARTVDFDPHAIYLDIDEPGTYAVMLSGRSTLFKIDRLVLFNEQVRFIDATRDANTESVCTEIETINLRPPDAPASPQPGIHYAYYEGNWSVLPNFDELTPIKTGIAKDFDIATNQRDDYFGFFFEGLVEAPADGLYTFYTISNAGSQLFIGDELVVDNDGAHATQERNGFIALSAGLHKISVLFFEDFWNEALTVSWISPLEGRQTLGEGSLFYDLNDHPPATYARFEGSVAPDGVALHWETASELNNAGFEIERRYDTPALPNVMIDASVDTMAFVPISFVNGSGTSITNNQYTFTDTSIPALASTVYYRIKQSTFSGAFTYSDVIMVELPKPENIALYPNYPNPFSQTTTVAFDLTTAGQVRLSLYKTTGQRVAILLDEMRPAGRNEITFTPPAMLPSGMYIYKLETPEASHAGTMTIVR